MILRLDPAASYRLLELVIRSLFWFLLVWMTISEILSNDCLFLPLLVNEVAQSWILTILAIPKRWAALVWIDSVRDKAAHENTAAIIIWLPTLVPRPFGTVELSRYVGGDFAWMGFSFTTLVASIPLIYLPHFYLVIWKIFAEVSWLTQESLLVWKCQIWSRWGRHELVHFCLMWLVMDLLIIGRSIFTCFWVADLLDVVVIISLCPSRRQWGLARLKSIAAIETFAAGVDAARYLCQQWPCIAYLAQVALRLQATVVAIWAIQRLCSYLISMAWELARSARRCVNLPMLVRKRILLPIVAIQYLSQVLLCCRLDVDFCYLDFICWALVEIRRRCRPFCCFTSGLGLLWMRLCRIIEWLLARLMKLVARVHRVQHTRF